MNFALAAIDEKLFSVLYSDKASRPNTPVNVIVGAFIIRELFDYSDDEMVENLIDERMKQLLTDADKLLALCESGYNDSTEYDLFVRCLSEQFPKTLHSQHGLHMRISYRR